MLAAAHLADDEQVSYAVTLLTEQQWRGKHAEFMELALAIGEFAARLEGGSSDNQGDDPGSDD
jgi:hypothetical protein